MWVCHCRLLTDRQCRVVVFLVSYLIISCVAGSELGIGSTITTLGGLPTATWPLESVNWP